MQVKEINIFTNGDSADINTWSNVPYFFTENLISKGIKVNRINLNPSPRLNKLFDYTWGKISCTINKETTYDYFRSLFHYIYLRYKIKKTLLKYPDADANIFLTFSFSAIGISKKPVIQFGDWTYQHYINYYKDRSPDFFEKKSINRENRIIQKADLTLVLFPGSARQIKQKYPGAKVSYIGNVVNNLIAVNKFKPFLNNPDTFQLLFIGSTKYKDGALDFIKAVEILNRSYKNINAHIVGMQYSDFGNLPDNIICYGYLNKNKPADRDLYYALLQDATLFINTSKKWGAFSACIESMYFYTPVIVAPYNEFIETFGSKIKFGSYCADPTPDFLAKHIHQLLADNNINQLSIEAHNAVKKFTWSVYIDRVLKEINALNGQYYSS